jgi:hypothetical protein
MPQIRLNHTLTTTTAPPFVAGLSGELSLALLAGPPADLTRIWANDGAKQRFLFSSDPNDPLGPSLIGGQFLPLAGGQMVGQILTLPPLAPDDAANKEYVDAEITALSHYIGTWQVATNVPNIDTAPVGGAGDYYIAVTAVANVPEIAPPTVPGIGGEEILNDDYVIWNGVLGVWQLIRGGMLTLQEADQRYVQVAGDTMTGPLILPAAFPIAPEEATNKAYVDSLAAAGTTILVDGVSILGDGRVIPLSVGLVNGGVF